MGLILHSYFQSIYAKHKEACNWKDYHISEHMVFSPRSTEYTMNNYPVGMHFHDYYELLIITEGDIRYICDGQSYYPRPGSMVLIPQGTMHMSILTTAKTHYTRYVFYFDPNAFESLGFDTLMDFLYTNSEPYLRSLKLSHAKQVLELIDRLTKSLQKTDEKERALQLSLILNIFYLFNKPTTSVEPETSYLPDKILQVQRYIDQNYMNIRSVSDLAAQFHYSREYLSRMFHRYMHMTIADYITHRRIAASEQLLKQDSGIGNVCYAVGFETYSSFVRAFKEITGMTPSYYKKSLHD